MEVTYRNFEELLPRIEAAISCCHFLAIDGEFSGLSLTPPRSVLSSTVFLPFLVPAKPYLTEFDAFMLVSIVPRKFEVSHVWKAHISSYVCIDGGHVEGIVAL
jgi:hypothetical protein